MDPTPPTAIDDILLPLLESDPASDVDGNVLANDTNPDSVPVTISEVGASGAVGSTVAGSSGGTFRIEANGDVFFDPNGDFDSLNAGETATTSVTYTIEFPGQANTFDVVLLQDLSGSFDDDLLNVQAQFPSLAANLDAAYDVQFGVASFIDKPVSPFGGFGDYEYQTDLAVTDDATALQTTLDGLVTGGGDDIPESQFSALLQTALRADTEIGFRSGAQRFVIVATDAEPHLQGDYDFDSDGNPVPDNDLDTVLENEDYPSLANVRDALDNANITPIFVVTGDVLATYQDIVTEFGFGVAVELTSDSSNIEAAITAALQTVPGTSTATVTVEVQGVGSPSGCFSTIDGTDVRDVIKATDCNETINGFAGNDLLEGRNGNDTVDGGAGNDFVIGDNGDDTLLGGAGVDDLFGKSGNDGLFGGDGVDRLDGGEGDDLVDGGAGNDKVYGGIGADTIVGGDGNDKISVNVPDQRQPDGFADELRFDAADGSDAVFGFAPGEDQVVLTDGGTFTISETRTGDSILRYGTTSVLFYDVALAAADVTLL